MCIRDREYYGYAQQVKTLGAGKEYHPLDKDEAITDYDGYQLAWSDEFNIDGKPSNEWSYETGFVRNEELQWYQEKNASVSNGCLIIEGKKEKVVNPNYQAGSEDWKTNRNVAEYTSSSLTTQHSHVFKYGRFEVRAKLPSAEGSWPAIWTLGNTWDWPMNGEIDIMECYLAVSYTHLPILMQREVRPNMRCSLSSGVSITIMTIVIYLSLIFVVTVLPVCQRRTDRCV